ncbi:hypothetical protein N483_02665 [Pseudoalteromonas luteoviolacea NCIMB 1944]|nr:hypothetical protein N483_02665 [Pseudoalteromonas luteoviolacea NCIMB 1944]
MKSMFKRKALFYLIVSLVSLCSNFANSNFEGEFEQAYAPVFLGNVTRFTPIDLKPDAVIKLSSKAENGYTSLAWIPSPQAEYYKILKFDGSDWRVVSSNVTTSFYRYRGSGSFRVVACHRYGCASNDIDNVDVSGELAIKAFYAEEGSVVPAGGAVRVGWQLSGATSAVITHSQYGSHTSKSIVSLGASSQLFNIQGDSRFTLTATGFDGESVSTYVNVATLRENPFLKKGRQSQYTQPLLDLNLDIVERTILQSEHHLVFSTHDGELYFFRANKIRGKPVSWQKEWSLTLDGIINSAPKITENYLYYNETNSQSMGRVCKVRLFDKQNLTCSQYYHSALLTSPLIINNDGDYTAKFVESLAEGGGRVSGVYAFYYNGDVRVFDQQSMLPKTQSFTLADNLTQPIISTPSLFLNKKKIPGLDAQILIKEQNEVLGVAIPKSDAQQFQSFGVLAIGQQDALKPMTVLWKGAL